MRITPKPFGHPAWVKVPRRIAKKILRYRKDHRNMFERFYELSNLRIGDLICTCDGLNSKVISVEPEYVKTRRGKVLADLRIVTTSTGCSMYNCGVGLPKSYEECVAYRGQLVEYWSQHYDEWGFAKKYAAMTINTDGTYTLEGA